MKIALERETQTRVLLNLNDEELNTLCNVLEGYRSQMTGHWRGSRGDQLAGRILDVIAPLSGGRKRVDS